jgi:hypothetical protein
MKPSREAVQMRTQFIVIKNQREKNMIVSRIAKSLKTL